jgi:hypothetical protein
MPTAELNPQQTADLAALAAAIIPPDEIDAGAAAVNAAPRLAEKCRAGINAALYLQGLALASTLARDTYGLPLIALTPPQLHDLIAALRDALPAFFKQLRMDVCALYLSDPAVWERIGFPGPSTQTGGYPDFDHLQTTITIRTKEIPPMPTPTPPPGAAPNNLAE